jgi:hypothetical protein
MPTYNETARVRNAKSLPRGIEVKTTVYDVMDRSSQQLTVGGRVVHHRTHRCTAFCNAVAALAGIGPVEVR